MTTVHTAITGTADIDEVYVYGFNPQTDARLITFVLGATGAAGTGGQLQATIPAEGGLSLLIPGLPFNNANVISAYATAADAISVVGWVNRVTGATAA